MQQGKRIGVGIIGTGGIAGEHALGLMHLIDRAVLIAAADTNPARLLRFGERFFFPFAHKNPQDLIERRDVDLVIVATPPSSHEQWVISSLEAGKHVICEKPLAHSLAAADRIIAAGERHPGKLSVSYQLRYDVEVKRLLWLMAQPGFDGPRRIECRRVTPVSPGAISRGWWGKWDVAGGGAVITQFIHQLDLLGEMLGPAQWVEASMSQRIPQLESEDTCLMKIGFAGDAVVEAFCSVFEGKRENVFSISGDFGRLQFPWSAELRGSAQTIGEAALQRYPLGPSESKWKRLLVRVARRGLRQFSLGHLLPAPPPDCSHRPYLSAVLEALAHGQPLPISAASARASLELTVAIYFAALTGERKTLPLGTAFPLYGGVHLTRLPSAGTESPECINTHGNT